MPTAAHQQWLDVANAVAARHGHRRFLAADLPQLLQLHQSHPTPLKHAPQRRVLPLLAVAAPPLPVAAVQRAQRRAASDVMLQRPSAKTLAVNALPWVPSSHHEAMAAAQAHGRHRQELSRVCGANVAQIVLPASLSMRQVGKAVPAVRRYRLVPQARNGHGSGRRRRRCRHPQPWVPTLGDGGVVPLLGRSRRSPFGVMARLAAMHRVVAVGAQHRPMATAATCWLCVAGDMTR